MPRAGLTRESVVLEAARVADEVGLGRLTMSVLAERLGVRQPSLYKHVDSVTALRRDVSVRAKGELRDALARSAVGRSGAEAIHAVSDAYRQWARANPGQYETVQLAPAPDDAEDQAVSLALVGIVGDVLAAFALTGADAIHAIRAFRSALHGFVVLEAQGAFALDVDVDDSFRRLVAGFAAALAPGGLGIGTSEV